MSKREIQDEITYLLDIEYRTDAEEMRLRGMRDMLAHWNFDNEEDV